MKKILFPSFNRVHLNRQKLLLDELSKNFQICITTYGEKDLKMSEVAVDIANKFQKALDTIKPDLALLRGDRYEMLIPATLCAYSGIPIAHIEGFDLSGVIDNRIRYAISYLSDYHFVTNQESYQRAKSMGFENVWNFGSLDCEFVLSVEASKMPQNKYLVVLYHPVPNESYNAVLEAVECFKEEFRVVGIKSNKDYGQQVYKEEYPPEDFINLLRNCSCLIGNSSAGIKEASVLGISVCNVGQRQQNRLKTKNVYDTECVKEKIEEAIKYQLSHKYEPDFTYYQPNSSKKIAAILTEVLKAF